MFFCKNSKLSDTEIANLFSSIESGTLQRDVFAAIVMYVLEDEMELTMIQAKSSLAGQVFVSNRYEGDTAESVYFDSFVTVLNNQIKKRTRRGLGKSEDCGCTDNDECIAGAHSCPVNSICTNDSPGYRCDCVDGFTGSGTSGSLICVNNDECTDKTQDCDINATCNNTIGSFDCSCKSG